MPPSLIEMSLGPEQLKTEIAQLALAEKLLLVEDIWDSIAAASESLPLPKWQKEALDKRYSDYRKKDSDLHDWKAVHEKLRKRHT